MVDIERLKERYLQLHKDWVKLGRLPYKDGVYIDPIRVDKDCERKYRLLFSEMSMIEAILRKEGINVEDLLNSRED